MKTTVLPIMFLLLIGITRLSKGSSLLAEFEEARSERKMSQDKYAHHYDADEEKETDAEHNERTRQKAAAADAIRSQDIKPLAKQGNGQLAVDDLPASSHRKYAEYVHGLSSIASDSLSASELRAKYQMLSPNQINEWSRTARNTDAPKIPRAPDLYFRGYAEDGYPRSSELPDGSFKLPPEISEAGNFRFVDGKGRFVDGKGEWVWDEHKNGGGSYVPSGQANYIHVPTVTGERGQDIAVRMYTGRWEKGVWIPHPDWPGNKGLLGMRTTKQTPLTDGASVFNGDVLPGGSYASAEDLPFPTPAALEEEEKKEYELQQSIASMMNDNVATGTESKNKKRAYAAFKSVATAAGVAGAIEWLLHANATHLRGGSRGKRRLGQHHTVRLDLHTFGGSARVTAR